MRRMVRERPECEAFVKDRDMPHQPGCGASTTWAGQAAEEIDGSSPSALVPVSASTSQ